mmetsp:Transcript_30858/g.88733  ORF Transcript_30858/g.88733 Transcript_30858/m.88733 type:complete len:368 (+) Transcript_30858:133-1236(+)
MDKFGLPPAASRPSPTQLPSCIAERETGSCRIPALSRHLFAPAGVIHTPSVIGSVGAASACALVMCRLKRQRSLCSLSAASHRTARLAVAPDQGPHEESRCPQEDGAPNVGRSCYIKVWVDKVHWVGEHGAILHLQQVYDPRPFPSKFVTILDSAQAGAFQHALFGRRADDASGDDSVCSVRVHGSRDMQEAPLGEVIVRKDCSVEFETSAPVLLEDILSIHEHRVPCEAGEALGTAHRLTVPVLLSLGYLLRIAMSCLDRFALEQLCRDDDQACDLELRELREQLDASWSEMDACERASALHSYRGELLARDVASLFHDLDAFAWFWAWNASRPGDGAEVTDDGGYFEFRERLRRFGGDAEAALSM